MITESSPPRRHARSWRIAAAAGWAALVAVLLWSSAPEGPPAFAWLARLEAAGGDKAVHAALFAVQAWLLCRSRPGSAAAGWLAGCFGLAVAYGVLTEVGQLAVDGRNADVADALADAAGAAAAVVGVALRRRVSAPTVHPRRSG